jgi:ribosomal peptide maturation radical SAM protein 1
MGDEARRVLLCVMPFGEINQPPLGIGLLKAGVIRAGFPCDVRYFCLDFARRIGEPLYHSLANTSRVSQVLSGEWIFTPAVFGSHGSESSSFFLRAHDLEPEVYTREHVEYVKEAQQEVEPFLEGCLQAVEWARYDIVGFTVTAQQLNPSLALAQRLKQRHPQMAIIFGGNGMAPPCGIQALRSFACVDYACLGEGDIIFPEFVRRLRLGKPLDDLPGLAWRQDGQVRANDPEAAIVTDLESLPYPDYDDYFEQFQANFVSDWQWLLYFESSRGCTWGVRNRCAFCGARNLPYRSKTPRRTGDEIQFLSNRYHPKVLGASDYLAPPNTGAWFARLKNHPAHPTLTYDLRATIKKSDLEHMKRAGVGEVFVGVESLSTPVLRLMRKGTTALTNIQVIKWCRELRIGIIWNLLYGFPGEQPEEYERMARLVPSLTHLSPPTGFTQVYLLRNSPYFDQPEGLGLANVRPVETFSNVLPGLPEEARWNLSTTFNFDYADGRNPSDYLGSLSQALEAWQETSPDSLLAYVDDGKRLRLFDTRPVARQTVCILTGLERELYLACDQQRSLNRLSKRFAETPRRLLRDTLVSLVEERWMVSEGDSYLSLGVDVGQYLAPDLRAHLPDELFLALAKALVCPRPT